MQNENKTMVKYRGTPVVLGAETYIIPPLNFRQLQELAPQIDILSSIGNASALPLDQMKAVMQVIHAAISRNYPNTTLDMIYDLVDLGNVKDIITAVLSSSGFVTSLEGGAKDDGPPLTGMNFTPT